MATFQPTFAPLLPLHQVSIVAKHGGQQILKLFDLPVPEPPSKPTADLTASVTVSVTVMIEGILPLGQAEWEK